jgi:hypothetical protein
MMQRVAPDFPVHISTQEAWSEIIDQYSIPLSFSKLLQFRYNVLDFRSSPILPTAPIEEGVLNHTACCSEGIDVEERAGDPYKVEVAPNDYLQHPVIPGLSNTSWLLVNCGACFPKDSSASSPAIYPVMQVQIAVDYY